MILESSGIQRKFLGCHGNVRDGASLIVYFVLSERCADETKFGYDGVSTCSAEAPAAGRGVSERRLRG